MSPNDNAFVKNLDCTPEKRSYLSIINDYNLNSAICELIDNPIDQWKKNGGKLNVILNIDFQKRGMSIEDDSGGIRLKDLQDIVRPGASPNVHNEATIGIFGVGSKRSVIALAKEVRITTRAKNEATHLIKYGDDWLLDSSWNLPCYEAASQSPEGHTRIELFDSRFELSEATTSKLVKHLGETYARFLADPNFRLTVNTTKVSPITFDENWAYCIRRRHKASDVERTIQQILEDPSILDEKLRAELTMQTTVRELIQVREDFEEKDARSFGIGTIWVNDFEDIPCILQKIRRR